MHFDWASDWHRLLWKGKYNAHTKYAIIKWWAATYDYPHALRLMYIVVRTSLNSKGKPMNVQNKVLMTHRPPIRPAIIPAKPPIMMMTLPLTFRFFPSSFDSQLILSNYVRQSDDDFQFVRPSVASCTLASIVPAEIDSESMLISFCGHWARFLRISLSYSSKCYFSEATTSQPLHGLLSNNTSCDHTLRHVYLVNGREKSTLLFPKHQNSLLSLVVLASWSKTNWR